MLSVEVPLAQRGEAVALLVHAEPVVVGDVRRVGGVAPRRRLLGGHAQIARRGLGMASTRGGGDPQVVRRHQVGEDVVAHDGGVLVGAGDAVEVPHAVPVVVSQRVPQPRRLDEHLQPALGFQRLVAR